ncbi:endonuclease/exonuclease/phosphatase family protein [Arenibacter sp. GZD96]|uniref:endonuclease/exonuclease/phosphatase family protein n=1 Tax=Aurantibrevibacter litoralis TaxID=3106030 RepID=UPI002AFE8289|nr:endonuclease/exonuclease/phosphatase family protein [Arenibacter sp. GZD-96]MEA1786047.1 endonuclease/exonuclease/phosphatase family protein [Arenibacter sp. GZD-96]
MKKNKPTLIRGILLICLVCTTPLFAQTKVLSYNIKYDAKSDKINNWELRKEEMVRLLTHYDPAFIGLQEALHNQLTYLNEALPTYNYIGVGRDDGKQKGEYAAILYDSTLYKVLQSNTFWLSKTPEKISKGWDAALERICTYGLFEHRQTKERIWVFNTHFDHVGVLARENSAQLIIDKIKTLATDTSPVILMGDFNLTPETKGISIIRDYLEDGKRSTLKPFYGPRGTFNGFDPSLNLDRRIDYIFVKNRKVKAYIHIDDRMENNRHISDHLPVYAIIE